MTEKVVGFGKKLPQSAYVAAPQHIYKRFPELENKRIFLFVSRLHEKKGVDLLIKAFAKVCVGKPDLHLVLAGPDPDGFEVKMKNEIPAHVFRQITFCGWLSDEEKWSAYKIAEVTALISHSENWGATVVESLGMATPVLITNKVNIHDIVEDYGAGLVEKIVCRERRTFSRLGY